jgi:hypothetical protein
MPEPPDWAERRVISEQGVLKKLMRGFDRFNGGGMMSFNQAPAALERIGDTHPS